MNKGIFNYSRIQEDLESTRIEGMQTTMKETFEAHAENIDNQEIREVLKFITALTN